MAAAAAAAAGPTKTAATRSASKVLVSPSRATPWWVALMIVEGAEVKPAGARAPGDHVAVIIPNNQWSPSQQGEEEEKEDDWSEFMPSCQVFLAKSKAYEELDKWQLWCQTYEANEIVDLCPDPKTMRRSPSKPPTPKKKKPHSSTNTQFISSFCIRG